MKQLLEKENVKYGRVYISKFALIYSRRMVRDAQNLQSIWLSETKSHRMMFLLACRRTILHRSLKSLNIGGTVMSGLFETKLLKYKKHIIQVFEDMFGQRYVYIDGKTQTYSINNAKRMISLCCQQ